MKSNILLVLLAPFLMLFAVGAAWAQEATGISACVFPIVDLKGDPAFAEDGRAITEAVREEFETAGYSVVRPEISEGSRAPVHGEEAADFANREGADLSVTGFFHITLETDTIAITVESWQRDGTLMAGFSDTERFGLSFYNTLHDRLVSLIDKVRSVTGAPRIDTLALAAARGLGSVTFNSPQEGVEVLLAGEKSLGTTSAGSLAAPVGLLKGGSDLALELRKPGYHQLGITVPATPRVELPALSKAHRAAIEISWTSGQPVGAGAGFGWFAVPDWVVLGVFMTFAAQLPALGSTNERTVTHLDTGVRAGLYLLPYDTRIPFLPASSPWRVRLGLSASAGLLATFPAISTMPAMTDLYVGAPSLLVELGTEDVVLFIRQELRYALGVTEGALGRGWISVYRPDTSSPGSYRSETPITLGAAWKW